MRTTRSMMGSGARTRLRAVVAVGAVGAILGAFGFETSAAAQPVSLTLTYSCMGYPSSVTIEADIPNSVQVGVATPRFKIESVVAVGAAAVLGANLIGVKTVEGSAVVKANVSAPQGDIPVTVPVDGPKTTVPKSGSAQFKTSAVAPSLKFSQSGRGKITISDIALHLVPKDARGNLTILGELDLTCKQDAGQDNVLMSFDITRATSSPTTSGPSGSTPLGATAPRTDGTTSPTAHNTVGVAASGTTTDPAPAGVALDSAGGADATPTIGLDLMALILPAMGILVLGAAALRFGPPLRYRRRRANAES